MLSERQLRALLALFEARMQGITDKYLALMGGHLKAIGGLKPSDVHRLTEMRRMGANVRTIQQDIARSAEANVADLAAVFGAVAAGDQEFAQQWFGGPPRIKGAPKNSTAIERVLKAQLRVTAQAFKNLSQTTIQSTAYREAVDVAIQTVQTGVTDYASAIRGALRAAGNGGLSVQYPSGLTRRLDSAVRQNVLDGVRSLNNDILGQLGNEYGADGVELSAHALCAEDHLPYQGRQFSRKAFEQLQASLPRPVGMWNCKHTIFPVVLGVSEPAHTPEELAAYARNSREAVEIDGRVKTRYEWTQEQRRTETAIRRQKDVANLAKASGDDVLRREAQSHINTLQEHYARISAGAGLTQQPERAAVAGFRRMKTIGNTRNVLPKISEPLTGGGESGIIRLEDEAVLRSLGAKTRNYDIEDKASGRILHYAEGTKVQNREVFAGYGTGTPLHEGVAEGLAAQYGGKPQKWQHVKGIGIIDDDGENVRAEVHWFQEDSVGQVKHKIKKWLE